MTLWKWSQTAATNATADSTINWAEGQAPSSVNDSARGMMAAVSKFRDDISGIVTTTGTSTGYIVASNQNFSGSLTNLHNQMIAFVPHTTNGGGAGTAVTLNVDSTGVKPIRMAPNVNIESGTLIQGTPYVVIYNNTDGAFYLRNFGTNPYQIPLGGMMPYTGGTAPNTAFILPLGQAISRTTYATLFNLYSALSGGLATYGIGNGTTTFNVPDLSNRIPVCWNDGTGTSRVTTGVNTANISGTTIGASGGGQSIALVVGNIPALDVQYNQVLVTPSGAAPVSLVTSAGLSVAGNAANPSGVTSTVNKMPPTLIVPYILRVI